MRRPLRNAFLLGVLVGLVVAVARAMRRDAAPAVPATPALRPAPASLPAPARATGALPTAAGRPATAPESTPEVTAGTTADSTPDAAVEPVDAAEPDVAAEPVEPVEPVEGGGGGSWASPAADGSCPDGFPIKAKESSGIFHQPGGLSYERTVPDRCYPDEAAAEADGFRAAKR